MDLGLFRRRRLLFWLWIICPLIIAVAVHFSVFFYSQQTAKALQERRAMATILPELVDALSMAETVIDTFPAIRVTAAEARSALTTRVSDLSSRHGFVVNSLRIGSLRESGPVQKLEVSIEGEGGLLAIMKFVDDLQSPDSLTALVSFSLRINTFMPTPAYYCALNLESGFAPSMRVSSQAIPQSGGRP